MSRRLGRRSGAAVVLVTALLTVVPATAAGADPVITVDQPSAGQTVETASVSFSGSVADSSALYSIRSVTLAVGEKSQSVSCDDTPCPFSWRVTLPLNGPYTLKVTATDGTVLLAGTTARQDRSFKVAAPPAKPVLDPPHVNDARNVELSWTRNTEGDMLYYAVFRKDPGGGSYRQVGGKITQPAAGSKVTYTDTTTSAFTGGDYSYQVVAVRKGSSGTADTEATSDPSGARGATVPVLATSTSTPPDSSVPLPPGTPGTPATATPTTKAGPPAGVDLSGFLSSRSQSKPVAPITIPDPPDTGFGNTLPFGARPPADDVEEGEAEAVPPRDAGRSPVIEQLRGSRPLVPIAGGLVLLLLALHMRLLNRRIKTAEADIPVDAAPPRPPQSVIRPEPVPRREPEPEPDIEPEAVVASAAREPVLYDVAEDDEWEAEWALHDDDFAPEPEPEPAPEPEPEPEVEAVLEPDPEPEPEPEPEPRVEVVELWAPPDEPGEVDEPDGADEADVDAIEVFEVVSPTRKRLARAGSR